MGRTRQVRMAGRQPALRQKEDAETVALVTMMRQRFRMRGFGFGAATSRAIHETRVQLKAGELCVSGTI